MDFIFCHAGRIKPCKNGNGGGNRGGLEIGNGLASGGGGLAALRAFRDGVCFHRGIKNLANAPQMISQKIKIVAVAHLTRADVLQAIAEFVRRQLPEYADEKKFIVAERWGESTRGGEFVVSEK
jgi:F0F1-type ATP synthase membrane subunit c/vacuolar-type H+-ATPase subunit K